METIETIQQLPELKTGAIHIWGVHVPDIQGQMDELHALLSKKEQEKATRFLREADRFSSIAARGALRVLLSGYTGISANTLAFEYSKTGKPSFVPPAASRQGGQDAFNTVSFNISHSDDWVVLAFGRDRHVGVDIERIKRGLDVLPVASRCFRPEEVELIKRSKDTHACFFQLWARKEAYVKACGSGVFQGMGNILVPIAGDELPDSGERDGWFFHRVEAGSKYAAAVVTDKALDKLPCYDFGGLKWVN